MKHTKKIFYFGLIVILVYCFVKLFSVFMLTYFASKKKDDLRTDEKVFFKELRQNYEFTDIYRTPEYNFEKPKDTCTYEIYFEGFNCDKSKLELNNIAQDIFRNIDAKVKLDKLYYKYRVVFYCKNKPPRIEFNYSRKLKSIIK